MSYSPQDSINDVKFVVFDLETTGLDYHTHNIIEIGAVQTTSTTIEHTFQTFIQIEGSIPPEATAINGITNEMIKDSPLVSQVLRDFLNFIEGSVLVAHNIGFDYRFLNSELIRNGFQGLGGVLLVDTLEIAKKALPSLARYSLEAIALHLDIDVSDYHRALNDAMACRDILFKCCDRMSMLGELPLSEILI